MATTPGSAPGSNGSSAVMPEDDLSSSQALVVDGNPTSRSILVAQLRDLGVGTVVQASRLVDARRQLEHRCFDVVLCENHFAHDTSTGQDLLDDLRRNQLLPFSTVFIMVTGEATYAKVAEAAESALDGYLLKPHKATHLGERLHQARVRKISLKAIFEAIDAEDFERAAVLCMERFASKGLFWLYAARVGAELLMRIGRHSDAQALYESVVEAKTLPWAKLGVARSQLDSGQVNAATTTLESLINSDAAYADAYDVLGRAQFEAGKFDRALATYRMASNLTPASISRLQNLGMISFYSGDRVEAEKVLDRTTRLGLESKMFDCQTLVLLAFARVEANDRKALQRCCDDFARLLERHAGNKRFLRLSSIVSCLALIQDHQFAQAVDSVRLMAKTVNEVDFDFEAAANLLALLSVLALRAIQLDEVHEVVNTIGMRFCTGRAITELLIGSCGAHPPYADQVRACQAQVLKLTESAMTLSMDGNPKGSVEFLVQHGAATGNAKLIETAHLVLNRYLEKIDDAPALVEAVQSLRRLYCAAGSQPALGGQKRQSGALSLRSDARGALKPNPNLNIAT